jgi:hypothetical protein
LSIGVAVAVRRTALDETILYPSCKRTWLKTAVRTVPNSCESSAKKIGATTRSARTDGGDRGPEDGARRNDIISVLPENVAQKRSGGLLLEIRLQEVLTRPTFFAGKLMMPSESLRSV